MADEMVTVRFKLMSMVLIMEKISNYDHSTGLVESVEPGTSLRECLKKAGIKNTNHYNYYTAGKQLKLDSLIENEAEITCTALTVGG